MQIPKDKVKGWKILHDRGDYKEIDKRFNVSRYKVVKAFDDYEATATVYKALEEFYTEKLVSVMGTKFSAPGVSMTMVDAIQENGGKI